MKISNIQIDGYGVWSGLRLERLTDGLNVVYGPNEAGKSTVLEFIRSMLYGFSPERRRYLPPVHGGAVGGTMSIVAPHSFISPHAAVEIERRPDPHGHPSGDRSTLIMPDGARQNEGSIAGLLSNIDEPTFNHVFALGLREMQELATLSDSKAASMLFNIVAGLDRVSLVEVQRELEGSRNRILDRSGGPSQLIQHVAQRDQLRQQLEPLQASARDYLRLHADRAGIDRDVDRLEGQKGEARDHLGVVELAANVRDRWLRRKTLADELAPLASIPPIPPDAIDRFDALHLKAQHHRKRLEAIKHRRHELTHELDAIQLNPALHAHAARIEAAVEQVPWFQNMESHVDGLKKEHAQAKALLLSEYERLGLGHAADPNNLAAISPKVLGRLHSPARDLRQARRQHKRHIQKADDARQRAAALGEQVGAALGQRQESNLSEAIDRAGFLVNQLRRRSDLDQRIEQMARNERELQGAAQNALAHQMQPMSSVVGLCVLFGIGAVLLIASFIFPNSAYDVQMSWGGGIMAAVGAIGMLFAGGMSMHLQRTNEFQLEQGQSQLQRLLAQIQQAKLERDAIDAQLPRGGGAMASRLTAAEENLKELENLTPLDAERVEAEREAEAADRRAQRGKTELKSAHRAWKHAVAGAGLPDHIMPTHLRSLMEGADNVRQAHQRYMEVHDDLHRHGRELDSAYERLNQLIKQTAQDVPDAHPLDQLHHLANALEEHKAKAVHHAKLRRRLRKLRQHHDRGEALVQKIEGRRRRILNDAGAKDEAELRRRAAALARAEAVRKEHQAIDMDIAKTVGDRTTPDTLKRLIEATDAPGLEAARRDARNRLTALENDHRNCLEKRGQLAEQIKNLVGQRQLGSKLLDLATVERRIDDAARRWQVLALTGHVLEEIRKSYESDRQPQTLLDASRFLEELTQGRYRRVWTPVGDQVLWVDDAQGKALPVEVLSRGTREQLFLGLRLALAKWYAQRGVVLPLILDDVLVNFDSQRARSAASVLRDFAAEGHQMLVFTCHEHIAKMFRAIKAPVEELPSNVDPHPPALVFEELPKEKPKRATKPPPPRKPEPEALAEVELADEEPQVAIVEPAWERVAVASVPSFADNIDTWEEDNSTDFR